MEACVVASAGLNIVRTAASRQTAEMLPTQNVNALRASNGPDAGKALVSGRLEGDQIGTGHGCHPGKEVPESRALPASRDERLKV